jgi:hypothetical protein
MKKLLLIPLFIASTAIAAVAGNVADLNAEILKILAPFQNENTVAEMKFSKAETNAERALSLAVSALYKKVGSQNTLTVDLKNIAYEYGNGTNPTTNVNAFLGLDLTKVLSQEDINQIVPNVEEMINQFKGDLVGQYGEALNIEVKITDRTQDEAGNYTGVKGSIVFAFDFSKLPEGQSKENIVVKSGFANLAVNVKTGLSIEAQVVSNTDYKGFQKDNEGLKELLDKFLSQDQDTLKQLEEAFGQLDRGADQIVNGQR